MKHYNYHYLVNLRIKEISGEIKEITSELSVETPLEKCLNKAEYMFKKEFVNLEATITNFKLLYKTRRPAKTIELTKTKPYKIIKKPF